MRLVAYRQTFLVLNCGCDRNGRNDSNHEHHDRKYRYLTEFAPGETMVLKTEAAEPVHYKFSKQVTYVNANVIDASKSRKDSKVQVHYVKDGDDMMVDKVIVTKDRD